MWQSTAPAGARLTGVRGAGSKRGTSDMQGLLRARDGRSCHDRRRPANRAAGPGPVAAREQSRMSEPVFVLNGANLNLLGVREPHLYGTTTLAEIEAMCHAQAAELDITVECRQSNGEATLI